MSKLKKISEFKLVIHPLFILLAFFSFLLGYGFYFLNSLLVVILHEYAHYFVAKVLGYRLNKMCLLPYGAQLNLSKTIFNSYDEIKVAIAGPLFNIVLGVLGISIWWLFPETYTYTYTFVECNIIIACFNLLPIVPLDGSRVLLAILSKFGKRTQGYKILNYLNLFVSLLLFICFIMSAFTSLNLSLGIIAIFIFVGAFEKDESYLYSSLFSFSKMQFLKNRPLKIRFYAVSKNISKVKAFRLINQNYYLVIVVLDDNMQPIRYIYESELDKYFLQ